MFKVGDRVIMSSSDFWASNTVGTVVTIEQRDIGRIGIRLDHYDYHDRPDRSPDFHWFKTSDVTLLFEPNEALREFLFSK